MCRQASIGKQSQSPNAKESEHSLQFSHVRQCDGGNAVRPIKRWREDDANENNNPPERSLMGRNSHRMATVQPSPSFPNVVRQRKYLCSVQVTRHSPDPAHHSRHQNRFTTDSSSRHGRTLVKGRHDINHGMLTYRLLKCREDAHVMGRRLIRMVGEETNHMFGPNRNQEQNLVKRSFYLRNSKEWLSFI
jgi:hypothetical protein